MPLTGTDAILGAAMKAAVDQVTAEATAGGQPVDRDAMFNALAAAINAYLRANALVTGTAAGGVVTAVIT